MSRIRKLETNIINNIAAGEIIESPSSVVKELIENSIDAKSSEIEVSLIDGGLKRIIVKDNGEGMSENDLNMAFKRHTTSKIYSKKDLFNIKTLGFRGEALPSIASASMMSAISATRESKDAYELKINGGDFFPIKKAALNKGTLIKVDNLFYNLPARKKFLKNESKELNKITNIVKSYALCYPNIRFKYYNNQNCLYNLSSLDLKNRIVDIFGNKYSKSIIEVAYKENDFEINGFVGNIDLLRKRRMNQFIFLNNRLIKDKMINDSIRKPYLSCIERNEHPFYVLNINIPFDSVDVNVHPNKNEVRFKSEKYLYHFIKKSITNSIKEEIDVTPTFFDQFDKFKHESTTSLDFRENLLKEIPEGIQEHFVNYEKFKDRGDDKEESELVESEIEDEIYYDIIDVWQIHNKYLLTEIKAGLLIIDQHVAHERVLYESAKENIEKNGLESQSLLFPQYLEFQDDEYGYIIELFPYLNNLGFRIREFGKNTIIIESSPIETPFGQEGDIINEILDLYVKYNEINSSFIEKMCATYACKAAIKAGEKLESQEMKHLINRLFLTKNPYYCPHGRPIIINLTEDELDERFERK